MKRILIFLIAAVWAMCCMASELISKTGVIFDVEGAILSNEQYNNCPVYVYDGVSQTLTVKAYCTEDIAGFSIWSMEGYLNVAYSLYQNSTRLCHTKCTKQSVSVSYEGKKYSWIHSGTLDANNLNDVISNNKFVIKGVAKLSNTSYGIHCTNDIYIRKANVITITWKNYDGSILTTSEVLEGTTPTFPGETPTKPADEQYTYTFSGWTPEIVKATGNATYTAQFTSTLNKYAVTFANYDGTPLQSGELEYGTTPTYTGATPTKPADAQYTYTFAGWDAELSTVTGAVTYTAQFTSTLNKYAVTFANYDGTLLQSGELEYGTTPTYTGETPTKPADEDNTYTFSGWTPAVVAVAGDATYTATFQSVPFVKYTITWQDEDGNVIKTDEVKQDATPAFTGTTPTKEGYTFAGWLPNIKPATKDMYYTTFFERNKIETPVYTVNINGENCSLNINNQYPEGTVITLEAVADECFEFQQWSDGNKDNPRTVTVTKDMSLTAEFNKVRYTVTGEPSTGGKVQIRKQ